MAQLAPSAPSSPGTTLLGECDVYAAINVVYAVIAGLLLVVFLLHLLEK